MAITWRNHLVCVASICFVAAVGSCTTAADTIAVNAASTFQTMTGWEAHARAWEEDKQANAYDPTWRAVAPKIAAYLVNEVGINRIQVPLRTGWINPVDYWTQFAAGSISYTEWNVHRYEKIRGPIQFAEFDFRIETMVLPMMEALAARGEMLYVNLGVVDFNTSGYLQGTLQLHTNPVEYAAFVLACFQRLKAKYGITANALELNNEPENTPWSGTQMGAALVAAKAALEGAGFVGLNYIGPSTSSAVHTMQYATPMLAVPNAAQALTTLSYHRYDQPEVGTISELAAFAKSKGLKTDMSEWINATADALLDDLEIGNVSSWQKWAIANRLGRTNPQAFYAVADPSVLAAPAIRMAPNTALVAAYFREVRLNAVRVAAHSSSTRRRAVAFVNANGTHVVVVRTAPKTGLSQVTIAGLQPGTYGVRTTSFGEQVTDLADRVVTGDGTLTLDMDDGFTTIYGKAAKPPTVALVEYRHVGWDHYFVTGIAEEIAKLDSGTFDGWVRTGQSFNAYVLNGTAGTPVCRFFSTAFAPRSSHFLTAHLDECAIVDGNPVWSFEGNVFNIALPLADGSCPGGTIPVYRQYNDGQGSAPSHRYTVDRGIQTQMIARGWIAEGLGPLGVDMCSPQ